MFSSIEGRESFDLINMRFELFNMCLVKAITYENNGLLWQNELLVSN